MENILLDQVLKQVQNREIDIEKARELICVLFNVSKSAVIKKPLSYCPKCESTDIRQYTKGTDKCNNCNHAWDIYKPFKGVE